ncbi:MAG TPA: futalosine hydrolase [Micromonosporaceae bacterium]
MTGSWRLLVVTAVELERTAVIRGLTIDVLDPAARIVVLAGGVGSAAAAAATARALVRAELAGVPFTAVISAGIAGGVPGQADPPGTVLATRTIAADLGADSPDGFLSLAELGFGSSVVEADPALLQALRHGLPQAHTGEVLTVCTVTGTAAGAATLRARFPDAIAEAMEGFGVATAAEQAGLAFAELRTVSNPIGPRDRASWRIGDALAALTEAAAALASLDR